MFHVILFEPEIPPNAGNAIRLCVNTGAALHLVRPLGFALDDARVRRAGLDYHELARVHEHESLEDCLASLGGARVFAVETSGGHRYDGVRYAAGDAFLFGRETSGLPAERLAAWPPDRTLVVHAEDRTVALVLGLLVERPRRVHFAHVSQAVEIALIRAAKERALPVTCEVACTFGMFFDKRFARPPPIG